MNRPVTDPYAVLGVAPGATKRQLQEAYRRLAKRYHPDLHHDARAVEQMTRINEAWDILSNPARRGRYDAGSRQPPASRQPRASRPQGASPQQEWRGAVPRAPWGSASQWRWPNSAAGAASAESAAHKKLPSASFPWGALLLAPIAAVALTALFTILTLISGVFPPLLLVVVLLLVARWALSTATAR